jgi:methylenetetrahydrofolate reductase (NADPH)
LRSGRFVITAEIAPALGATTDIIRKKVGWLKEYVTAANFTDNASAIARMSSIASSKICLDAGLEPVMQLQARDRNRITIASDAMGAAGLGIRNILCLSGDHGCMGRTPMPKPDQFDIDAIQMLWILRRMRDEGVYLDGREIKHRPQVFLGAAASPFGMPPELEAIRTEKKINAGAQFLQTMPVFDYDRFTGWLEALDKRNLLNKIHILAGLTPLRSDRAARTMAANLPGVIIPPAILKRMEEAGDPQAQQEEGIAIALAMMENLKRTPKISGIHVMAIHWEEIVPRLVKESGLHRPTIEEKAALPDAQDIDACRQNSRVLSEV